MAIEYYDKALSIRKSLFGENNDDVATSFWLIADAYETMKDETNTIKYYN